MDILEQMVNDHADKQQKQALSRVATAKAKSLWLHLIRAVIAVAIGGAFMLFEHFGLAAPELSIPIALAACMASCYFFGQFVQIGKRVR